MVLPPEEEAAIKAINAALQVNLKEDPHGASIDSYYTAKENRVHKISVQMDRAAAHHYKYGKDVKIKKKDIRQLPAEIGHLTSLDMLVIDFPTLGPLPSEIANLKNLTWLSLTSMVLEQLPDATGNLENLETLMLHCDLMTTLPASVGNLKRLKKIHVWNAPAKFQLPETILHCTSLESIAFQKSQIRAIPDFLANLPNLKKILLIDVKMDKFPRNIGKFPHVDNLLFRSPLTDPDEIQLNKKLKELGNVNEYGEITGEALKYLKEQFK